LAGFKLRYNIRLFDNLTVAYFCDHPVWLLTIANVRCGLYTYALFDNALLIVFFLFSRRHASLLMASVNVA